MGFLNQAIAQRKCLQAIDCKLSGLDVIYDICNVPVCICIQHRVEHIFQCCLRTFNLRGHQGLFAHIHGYEQSDIWNAGSDALQNGKLGICLHQQSYSIFCQLNRRSRRQRIRDKRPVGHFAR